MNSNQEHSDGEVDRWLQAWGSEVDCKVSPSVREHLIRRAARPRNSISPRVTLALAAAAGLALLLGTIWIATKKPTADSKSDIANAEPVPDIQQLKKESAEALDALELDAKLLAQKLLLVQLQSKIDHEMAAIRGLGHEYERRVRLDRAILTSHGTSDHPTQP